MDLYILDKSFETLALVDAYESFIWTTRYYGAGDFELVMPAQMADRDAIKKDNYVSIRGSEQRVLTQLPDECRGYTSWSRLMVIETIETTTDEEDGDKVKVTGRSLASLLNRRVVWDPYYSASAELGSLSKALLNANVINPSNSKRKIANFKCKNKSDTTTDLGSVFYWGENLYDVLYDKFVEQEVGFDVILLEMPRNASVRYYLYFDFYKGIDRSFRQNERPYVVFSPKYDNFLSSTSIESDVDLKTACLVIGEAITQVTVGTVGGLNYASNQQIVDLFSGDPVVTSENASQMALGASQSRSKVQARDDASDKNEAASAKRRGSYEGPETGLDRREVAINSSASSSYKNASGQDVQMSESEYQKVLSDEGKTELGDHKTTSAYSGEIQAEIQFVLGRDFDLGDIVQAVNGYGVESTARVTEIIYSFDQDGYKMYPTFLSIDREDEK